ncbi:hypothetical protein Pint_05220 [Pistacia integerrima]|uniref:Uncharacterized protein n=1 Tax=Pistacia integerrima TaxID=434235 RepID=A0ACC0Z3X1_9ROSI|nr:hypothetical protein Pint_05220 [Pistacia integerrima]
MGSRTVRPGAEDEKEAANGMPSFDSQLPISNTLCTEGSTIQTYRVSDFGAFEHSARFPLEDAVNLSGNTVINSTKAGDQAVVSNPLQIGTFDKTPTQFNINPSTIQVENQRLLLEKGQQLNLVSISSGNTENWGESNMADASPRTDISTDADTDEKNQMFDRGLSTALVASDSSDRSKDKMDQKTLRRLAQNREAARKSRLRKKVYYTSNSYTCWKEMYGSYLGGFMVLFSVIVKLTDLILRAYVQQLESSRLKLTQLEQELQRARQQGIFISSSGDQAHSMSGNGAMAFDVEYARWLEEHNKQINELRSAVNSHASDTELRIIVDGIMAHYDEIFRLKSNAAKADVFHLLSGMWKTPAERCFLWLGGFRSSELLKVRSL